MFSKIKLQLILGVAVAGIGIFVSRYLNNHSFVSDKFIKQKSDSISILKVEVKTLDSLSWSLQQDVDICKKKDTKYETVIAGLTAENKRLINAENTCCEELKHAEETGGIIRYNWLGKVKKKK